MWGLSFMTLNLVHYMCHCDFFHLVWLQIMDVEWNYRAFLVLDLKRRNNVLYLTRIYANMVIRSFHITFPTAYLTWRFWKCSRVQEGTAFALKAWKWNDAEYQAAFSPLNKKAYLSGETHFNVRSKCGARVKVNARRALLERDHRQKINNLNNNKKAYWECVVLKPYKKNRWQKINLKSG